MSRPRFVEQERRLAAELSAKSRGTASVKIEVLHFLFKELREEDEKNTQRLKKLFRKEKGCPDWEILIIFLQLSSSISTMTNLRDPAFPRSSFWKHAGHLELDFPTGFRLPCLRG